MASHDIFAGESQRLSDLLRVLPGSSVDLTSYDTRATSGFPGDGKKDAEKVERDLMAIVPKEDWTLFSNLIVHLGRDLCTAKAPRHAECPILHLCPTGIASTGSAP